MKVNGDSVTNENKIKQFLDANRGYISTSDFLKLNISKPLIKKYVDKGLINKVSHGLYLDSTMLVDDEYVFQKRYPDAIYSYKTALSMLGLFKELPEEIEITVNSKKRVLSNYKVHYVADKYYNIGIIKINNMFNNPIKIYNAERCICDMLKSDDFDLELQNKILHDYFNSSDKNTDKLLEYSKVFNIYEKVRTLVDYAVR